jgi:hypothetical protein
MKILTEGERYFMSLFNLVSYKDQGIYDTINNLGSLLPRLIFSTLEESAYAYFQQTLSRTKTNNEQILVTPTNDKKINQQPPTPTGRILFQKKSKQVFYKTCADEFYRNPV